MKIDLHTHTEYSNCSDLRVRKLKELCKKKEIVPAITDHNTIAGALEYKKLGGKCIVGEEVSTRDGEIIGLFLKKEIKKGMGIKETVAEIKKQGGLVMLQHPFDRYRRTRITVAGLKQILDDIDIAEVFNSRTVIDYDNKKAERFAKKFDKPMVACSDSHFAMEVGKSYVVVEGCGRKDLLQNLKACRMVKRKSSSLIHIKSKFRKLLRWLRSII